MSTFCVQSNGVFLTCADNSKRCWRLVLRPQHLPEDRLPVPLWLDLSQSDLRGLITSIAITVASLRTAIHHVITFDAPALLTVGQCVDSHWFFMNKIRCRRLTRLVPNCRKVSASSDGRYSIRHRSCFLCSTPCLWPLPRTPSDPNCCQKCSSYRMDRGK
jgi:hypothetical protein